MKRPKVLHVDENHPILIDGLEKLGFENIIEYELIRMYTCKYHELYNTNYENK